MEARDVPGFLANADTAIQGRGLTRISIARHLGCKPETVYDWFNGKKVPHPRNQRAVCEMLDLPFDKMALTPDQKGDYPDGMGVCECCGAEFATFCKAFRKHCSRGCASKSQSTRQFGELNPSYKNGRKLRDGGYVQVLVARDHPMAGRGGYALEHRYVMSEHLGRPLARYELVHHINGDRTDNRIENLELCGKDGARHPPGQRMRDVLMSAFKHPAIIALPREQRDAVEQALRDVLKLNGFK